LLLVDIDPEIAAHRIGERMERTEMFEDMDNLDKTRKKVLRLAENGWEVLNNNVTAEESQAALVKILEGWDAIYSA